ncbi:Protein RTA1 [Lasiodiplodia theobromae]|uniref:Protein RTA1 n=1 Tax=Lasiodiplodia theobromae TaxID=45133 RepID=A0A5N5D7A9_9PEZI|nr:Protein RTA1 [Lasiodiplodia theobromae]
MARRGHALYAYRPSKAGAIIFCLLFIAATAFHLWRMIRCRSWFMTAFVIGGMLEFIGYACRTASASQPFNNYTLYPFAIQNSYILLAPTLFAASIYMTLGRVIFLTGGEARSPVPRRWLTKAFVAGDILCLVVQGGGGGMSTAAALSSSGGSALLANAGKGLTIFGLVAQLVIFAGFVGVAGTFHRRLNEWPTAGAIAPEEVARGWKRVMGALYVCSDSANHPRPKTSDNPELPVPMQQRTIISKNDQSLGPSLLHECDKIDRNHYRPRKYRGRRGCWLIPRLAAFQIEGPFQVLNSISVAS